MLLLSYLIAIIIDGRYEAGKSEKPAELPKFPSPMGEGRGVRKALNNRKALKILNPLNIRWDVGGADAFLSDLG